MGREGRTVGDRSLSYPVRSAEREIETERERDRESDGQHSHLNKIGFLT